jgi:hypothetical protein
MMNMTSKPDSIMSNQDSFSVNQAGTPSLNRDLLRSAGEHLGTLAERAHEQMLLEERMMWTSRRVAVSKAYNRHAKLSRLSREVLEIANG